MEKYIGVKFQPEVKNKPVKHSCIKNMISAGNRLGDEGMVFANAGNLSVKTKNGFIISAAGTQLDRLDKADFVLVTGCDIKKKIVHAEGTKNPSSEAILHHLIYQTNPTAKAIVHAHAGAFLNEVKVASMGLLSTDVFLQYGTIELAYNVVKTMGNASFIIIKEHGAVSIGENISDAVAVLINKYRELKGLPVRITDKIVKEQVSGIGYQGSGDSGTQKTGDLGTKKEESENSDGEIWLSENSSKESQAEQMRPEPELEVEEPKSEPEEPEEESQTPNSELRTLNSEPTKPEKYLSWSPESEDKTGKETREFSELEATLSQEQSLPPEQMEPAVRLPRAKIRFPGFKKTIICPECGTKKKFLSKSCSNCGFFFNFNHISSDTTNFIKIKRKKEE